MAPCECASSNSQALRGPLLAPLVMQRSSLSRSSSSSIAGFK